MVEGIAEGIVEGAIAGVRPQLFVGSQSFPEGPIRQDGTLGRERVLVQFTEGQGPDGIAFGADGNPYVTHRGTGLVVVVDPAGRIIARSPSLGASTGSRKG